MKVISEGLKANQNIRWIFLYKKLRKIILIWLQLTFKREFFSLSTWSPNFGQFLSCNVKTMPGLLPIKATVQSSTYVLRDILIITDYGRPERKQHSLNGRKFTPTPKFLGTAEAYFVCHIGPIFQIFLIYAFIRCP